MLVKRTRQQEYIKVDSLLVAQRWVETRGGRASDQIKNLVIDYVGKAYKGDYIVWTPDADFGSFQIMSESQFNFFYEVQDGSESSGSPRGSVEEL